MVASIKNDGLATADPVIEARVALRKLGSCVEATGGRNQDFDLAIEAFVELDRRAPDRWQKGQRASVQKLRRLLGEAERNSTELLAGLSREGPRCGTHPTVSRRSGRLFAQALGMLSPKLRQHAIMAEAARGNVPELLAKMIEVPVAYTDKKGVKHTGNFRVAPDYFAVGCDQDFVRVVATRDTAHAIARMRGCVLPTIKMVDLIHAQATKLVPQPWASFRKDALDDRQMVTPACALEHHDIIEQQRAKLGVPLGTLLAGHKKDIVVSNMAKTQTPRLAFYGWHKTNGKAIQGRSTIHFADHVEYPLGFRLVDATMTVDGRTMKIEDVLKDPSLAGLISDEGPIVLDKHGEVVGSPQPQQAHARKPAAEGNSV